MGCGYSMTRKRAVALGILLAEIIILVLYSPGEDFVAYYSAAHNGYSTSAFLYPVSMLVLVYPIAWLPFRVAYLVWVTAMYTVFGMSLWLWKRDWDWVLWGLACTLVWVCMCVGQVTPLIALLMALAYRAGGGFWSGFLLGLGAIKPHLVMWTGPAIFLRGKWKMLLGWCVGVGLVMLPSLPAMGSSGRDWVEIVSYFMRNPYSIAICRWVGTPVWAFVIILAGVWWFKQEEIKERELAMGLILSLWLGINLWEYDLILLAPAVLYLGGEYLAWSFATIHLFWHNPLPLVVGVLWLLATGCFTSPEAI